VNCSLLPSKTEGFAGVTAIDTSTAGETVNVVEPVTLPSIALTVELPVVTPVARPPIVIVATPEVNELHVTKGVKFSMVPFV
jgi:hypothetical protein